MDGDRGGEGSVPALRQRLAELGIVSKRRVDRHGRETGGGLFSRGALYTLLRNPTYIGKVRHKGKIYDGQHDAILDDETWDRAQALLTGHGGHPIAIRRAPARRPLDGWLFDGKGRPMRTTYALKSNAAGGTRQAKRYWYYVSGKEVGIHPCRWWRSPLRVR